MTFLFAAFLTVFSSKFTSVTEVCQRIQALINDKNNIAAAAAMQPLGILVDDLFTPVAEDIDRMISEDFLHASPYGVEILANRVADCIKANA